MNEGVPLFFCALGLAFALEGILWAVFPRQVQRAMRYALRLDPERLRWWGFMVLCLGLGLVAVTR